MKKKFMKKDITIIVLSLFLLIFTIYIEKNKKLVKDDLYDEKYRASRYTEICIQNIRQEKIDRGIEIDTQYDINDTGIIGIEFNEITTTLGALDAKRTSSNPNFAAIMVHLIREAGLKSGDNVAINFSSSFPALNIATINSCEVLGINPIIITSIGSSTWGGNNIEFTYLDMEEFLFNRGLIENKSKAISPGGAGDVGKDMDLDTLSGIIDRMRGYGREIIVEENLEKNVELRYNLYYEDVEDIEAFINIGGNLVSFGNTMDSIDTLPGIIKGKSYDVNSKTGLVQLFNSKRIPVIHILNIKELAHRYGLEVDPNTPFEVGKGGIYYTYEYPIRRILAVVIITMVILIIFRKRTRIPYDW